MVNFHGGRVTAYLPFPFSVGAFVAAGESSAELAHAEFERVMLDHGWDADGYSDVPVLEALPWLQELASELSDFLLSQTPGQRLHLADAWARQCAASLEGDLPPSAMLALGLERREIVAQLTAAALDIAELTDDGPAVAVSNVTPTDPQPTAPSTHSSSPALPDLAARARPDRSDLTGSRPIAGSGGPPQSSRWYGNHPHAVPCAAAAAMLLIAPAEHPYGYYQVLRVVVFAVAALLAYLVNNWRSRVFAVQRTGYDIVAALAVAVAVLFNPLVPVTLDRSVWAPIDVLAAAFLGLSILMVQRPPVRRRID